MEQLSKSELKIEALMRGIQIQDQWTAAKILTMVKEVPSKQVDYSLHCPKVTNLSSELNNFQVAKEVLQEYFEKVMEKPSTKRKVRLSARLKHWMFRLLQVKSLLDKNELQQVIDVESVFQGYLDKLKVLPTHENLNVQNMGF